MGLILVVIAGGLLLGAARGGSPGRLSSLPLRRKRLLLTALIAQFVAGIAAIAGSRIAYDLGLALSAAAAVAFCAVNRRIAGLALVGAGVVLNTLVMAANGAMPVSTSAASRAGLSGSTVASIASGEDPRHELSTPATRLPWLGDDVPVPLPVNGEVLSPGDVLVAAGIAEFLVSGMGRSTRRPGQHRRERTALASSR